MRRNIVAEIMAEHIIYGGLLATRAEVYADALGRTGSWRAADMYACGPRAVAVDPLDHANRPTLAQVRSRE